MWGIIVQRYRFEDALYLQIAKEHVRDMQIYKGEYGVSPDDTLYLYAFEHNMPYEQQCYLNSLKELYYVSIEECKNEKTISDDAVPMLMLMCNGPDEPVLMKVKKIDAPQGKGRNENSCGPIMQMTE